MNTHAACHLPWPYPSLIASACPSWDCTLANCGAARGEDSLLQQSHAECGRMHAQAHVDSETDLLTLAV